MSRQSGSMDPAPPGRPYLGTGQLTDLYGVTDLAARQCRSHLRYERMQAGCATVDATGAISFGVQMPTIAVIEDERNVLNSVSAVLESAGYRTLTYTNDASALDGLETNPPDLVIMDVALPNIGGLELIGRLRQKSDTPVL